MRKSMIVWVLVVLLVIILPTYAFADFDYSVFQNNPALVYSYDEMEDSHQITFSSADGLIEGRTAIVEPMIIGLKSEGLSALALVLQMYGLDGEGSIGLSGYIIKTDTNRYTGDLVDPQNIQNTVPYIDNGRIICGETSLSMVSDMLNSETVKVRLTGRKNIDYTMNATQIAAIKTMYDAFVKAGGMDQDFKMLNSLDSCVKH